MLVVGKPIGGGVPAAAYGLSGEVAAGLEPAMLGHEIDVAGVGGTLTGNALALAAVRATLSSALREQDFAVAIPLAERWAAGVAGVIEEAGLPWHVQQLGARAEYWFCPRVPRRGGRAAWPVGAVAVAPGAGLSCGDGVGTARPWRRPRRVRRSDVGCLPAARRA